LGRIRNFLHDYFSALHIKSFIISFPHGKSFSGKGSVLDDGFEKGAFGYARKEEAEAAFFY
jgi:hypothetical protein